MTKIADDVNSIAARLKEIQEEKLQAIMGQPLEHKSAFDDVAEPVEAPKDIDWTGMYGYPCGYTPAKVVMMGDRIYYTLGGADSNTYVQVWTS